MNFNNSKLAYYYMPLNDNNKLQISISLYFKFILEGYKLISSHSYCHVSPSENKVANLFYLLCSFGE